jgi:glyoxylase-like metal-dependent hydrolase (beta-lactamase superfamily II)
MFGSPCKAKADVWLKDGETYTIEDMSFQMISTPGHTEGSCVFYFEEGKFVVSGDTLFEESVGRTDFPTGSMSVLVRNIKQKLFVLPEETIVYPGHGGSTTIGWEKTNNPFIV